MVQKCGPNGADYDSTCRLLKTQLADAQADLIAGAPQEAEGKVLPLRKLRFQLYGWALKAQEKLEWTEKRFAKLQEETKPWVARHGELKTLSMPDEVGRDSFKPIDTELNTIKNNLDQIADHVQKGEAISAHPFILDTSMRLRKLPKLTAMIELD